MSRRNNAREAGVLRLLHRSYPETLRDVDGRVRMKPSVVVDIRAAFEQRDKRSD